jgi:hypothetical protein
MKHIYSILLLQEFDEERKHKTSPLNSASATKGTEMLPRHHWTPGWMVVYQAAGDPGPNTPAYQTNYIK